MSEPVSAMTHFVNGHAIRPPFPDGLQQAWFAMGCFWGAERLYWQLPGVYATAVGYAGGTDDDPDYRSVCAGKTGHAEAVLVVFDPKAISYGELLRVFWESHDPTQGMRQGNDVGPQYRSVIFCADAAQRATAEASLRDYGAALAAAGAWAHHDRDPRHAGVLLRRGLSPAVPREESGWVLRDRGLWSSLQTRGVTCGGEGVVFVTSQVTCWFQ